MLIIQFNYAIIYKTNIIFNKLSFKKMFQSERKWVVL